MPVLEDQLQRDGTVVVVGTEAVGGGDRVRQRIGGSEQHRIQRLRAAAQPQFQMPLADDALRGDLEPVAAARFRETALCTPGSGSKSPPSHSCGNC